mgnify:FL=1
MTNNYSSRITIDEIAKKSGVSKTTVSRVINNKPDVHPETRTKINAIIAENNFHPNLFAKGKTAQKINHIGLIVPQNVRQLFYNQFYLDVLQGILDTTEKRNYYLLFCYVNKTNYVEMFEQKRVEGFILLSPAALDQSIIRELKSANIPLVSTAKVLDDPEIPFVDIDNYQGAVAAVKYLISLGHSKIAFFGKPGLTSNYERMQGYKNTLEEANISVNADYIQTVDTTSIESGKEIMKIFLDMDDPPTAVFTACDIMAFGAIKAIQEAGLRVPEDISVIGFDDISLSRNMDPPLTTIMQPAFEKGELATEMLIDSLSSLKDAEAKILNAELVVRRSTCRVGNKQYA